MDILMNQLVTDPPYGVNYDPILGSGTTLLAAEQNDRICYGIELDPAYCDIIVERWIRYRKKIGKDFIVKKNGQVYEDFA